MIFNQYHTESLNIWKFNFLYLYQLLDRDLFKVYFKQIINHTLPAETVSYDTLPTLLRSLFIIVDVTELLLILGTAILVGSIKYQELPHDTSAQTITCLLALSILSMLMPASLLLTKLCMAPNIDY
jgi:hypothetical protein